MPQSEYKAREMRAKTHEVYEYDHDETKPGKPLHILIPGGLIALATLALIIFIGYQTYLEESLSQDLGNILMLVLAPFYVGGVFLFSYGYELYNIPRAIRLTAIIVFVTLAAVVIIAVLFLALGNMKGGSSKSSSSRSKSSSKSSGSAKPSSKSSGLGGGLVGGAVAKRSSSLPSSSSSGGGDILILGGGGRTRVETREVTKEVIKEVPKEPMPITCPFCTRSYIPVEHKYICPSCGAATPKDLIEESQMPNADDA
ncbi:MAG: hypothetical protein Q8L87_14770 [Anaerolineales bacterium]|nr:hypothetical protein [Anaerolineales bacterium]